MGGKLNRALYESDYVAWIDATAEAVRRGDFDGIDREALAEEVEDLGRLERRAVANRSAVLLAQRLKWDHLPGRRSGAWSATIELQRRALRERLEESPSLRGYLESEWARIYAKAALLAVKETGLAAETFPADCPWTLDQA